MLLRIIRAHGGEERAGADVVGAHDGDFEVVHVTTISADRALGAASWVSGFAVVLAIVTGRDNIYSIPEYSGGGEGKTFFHAFAHFFIAPLVAGLIAWGLSYLVKLVTKATTRTVRTAA